jgi:hypothetical protein
MLSVEAERSAAVYRTMVWGLIAPLAPEIARPMPGLSMPSIVVLAFKPTA